MGKAQIDLDKELAKTRRALSRRLMKALREGRISKEIQAIDREGRRAWGEMMNGHKGRRK